MMGQMNIVPVLGRGFNEAFPILVGLLCVCNLLNVYPKLVHYCGLDGLEFEWASRMATDTNDILAEGRRLVERERRRRSEDRSLLEMHERTDPESGRRSIPLRVQIGLLIEDRRHAARRLDGPQHLAGRPQNCASSARFLPLAPAARRGLPIICDSTSATHPPQVPAPLASPPSAVSRILPHV
ncbi:unnamed protein product [Prorocentrum cordatum]|uniref:Uncharacterized protein n=1 Tax=Prorocentrum cordatum TaxID=2364126 RepID=A0ABN9UKC6_9DINO|nr:unnamed protein product [Polarella glacialis]